MGNIYDPGYNDGTAAPQPGGIFLGFGLKGWLTHYNRVNAFNSYVQDDFKVSPKLTVNVGVRWEYDGFPNDKSGRFANVWASQLEKINTGSWFLDPANTAGTLTGFVLPSNYDKSPGLTAPSGASGVLVNGNQTLVPGSPWHNFAPRLGLAWQPLGDKFVVRAGYGLFYDRIYGNLLIDNQLNLPPYSGSGSGPSPASYANTLHDPFYAGQGPLVWTPRFIHPGFFAPVSSALSYTADSPQMANRLPLTQQYNLDLQYEFAKGWVADIGYVGSHGTHLYNWSQLVNVAHLVSGAVHNPTAGSNFPNTQNIKMIASSLPYNDPANVSPLTENLIGFLFANTNERVHYLGFSPGGMAETNTNGDSLYNSLQTQLRHQFSHGLLFQVSYTWSKEFTNVDTAQAGSGIQPAGAVIYGASNSNNPLDLRQQYGLAAFNRSHRAVITYSYDLPWKHTEGFSGKALGGWTISGVTTIQNGEPFTITDGAGGSIYGAGTSRAALAQPVNCNAVTGNCQSAVPLATSGSNKQRLGGWMNAAAFLPLCTTASPSCPNPIPSSSPYCIGGSVNGAGSLAAPCGSGGAAYSNAGTGYGNSGIGSVMGPGQFNFDMVLAKSTKVWEHGTIQFRAEAYNIWNHAQFNPPPGIDVNVPSTFGKITSSSVTPRVIQFGLKYLF